MITRDRIVKDNPIPFFFRIVYLSNNYRDPLLRTIENDLGLTRPEFSILMCLAQRDGLSAIDVSEITRQPQNTVARGVLLLARKGLIRKETSKGDARRSHLYLTAKGGKAYASFIGLVKEANRKMIAGLTQTEVDRLDVILDKMCDGVTSPRE